jgi:small subunit ribosomal protein S20
VANIKSQIKRNRQNEVRRLRNKAVRTSLKTTAKKVRLQVSAGELDSARELAGQATRDLDRAASKGVLHKRSAARRKSRLARSVQVSD